MLAQQLLLATRNAHKTAEIREMLGAKFRVEDLNWSPRGGDASEELGGDALEERGGDALEKRGGDASRTSGGGDAAATGGGAAGWPEIEETADTFLGNATLKAVGISEIYDGLVLSDDSGLEVDALNGAPGVWSARFAGENATDAENRALLLEKLAGVRGKARGARFRCTMVVARRGALLASFEGAVEGIIVNEEKGAGGFGYDSLFVPEGFCETFGQLPAETKNQLSHRARALEKVIAWLQSSPPTA